MRHLTILAAVTFVALSGLATQSLGDVIVPVGGKWSYLHPTDGTDPGSTVPDFHTKFYTVEFDDSSWKTGNDTAGPHGGFGYGEQDFTGVDLGTPEANNRKTAYFRHYFKTEKGFKDLVLKCQRDDGLIIYLDGKEVGRDSIAEDAKEAYDLHANKTISGEGETTIVEIKLKGELGAGDHVLSISLHNREQGSTDLRLAEVSLEGAAADGEKKEEAKKE
jgi:hypothetical protein